MKNVMAVPRLIKIVINMGLGLDAPSLILTSAVAEKDPFVANANNY